MCALRPGRPRVSDRIHVRSIVGRFLEHSRIFYFENGGDEDVYLGSADWMPRNLYERVEVLFPLRDSMLRHRVRTEILEAYLADNCKARVLRSDGTWLKARRKRGAGFTAQKFLLEAAEGNATLDSIPARRARSRTRTRNERTTAE
jgi:polyphosphate kinase